MTLEPRLIGRKEAAAYLGISEGTFSGWVAAGTMPQPFPGTCKWDKKAIDAKLDQISGLVPAAAARPSSGPTFEFDEWQDKQRLRDEYAPQLKLNSRQENILRFMIENPDRQTHNRIPRASERSLEILAEKKVIRAGPEDENGRRIYKVTRKGRTEVDLISTWRKLKSDT